MHISARTQMLHRYTVLESLDVIKKLGFDGVEIGFSAYGLVDDCPDRHARYRDP